MYKTIEGLKMGYDTKGREVGEDKDTFVAEITSVSSLLSILEQELYQAGYQMIPSLVGKFCGYEVYTRAVPVMPGVTFPESFHFWRAVNPQSDLEREPFLRAVKKICERWRSDAYEEDRKAVAKMWNDICLAFLDNAADPKNIVSRVSISRCAETPKKTVTVSGKPGAFKFIPALSWFTPELQGYDVDRLLTLFPSAEKRQFKLILGRLAAGASDLETMEGTLRHTARSYAIVVGREAGMGKSTLLKYLVATIETLGYSTFTINPELDKFSWSGVALADLAYIDDLTAKVQKDLISNNNLKSVVSNGVLFTQEKGIQGKQTRSVATVLGLTNDHNYSDFIQADSGNLSRLNMLDTYASHELPNREKDLIEPFWNAEASRLGVTVSTLMALLLRRCLDLFLEATGHRIEDGLLVKDRDKDRLYQLITANREEFRIDVSLKHVDELPKVTAQLCALAIARASEDDDPYLLMDKLAASNYSPELLLETIALFCHVPKMPEGFDKLQLQEMTQAVARATKGKLSELSSLYKTTSAEGAFRKIISECSSDKGFQYPQSSTHYQAGWTYEKRMVPQYIAEWKASGVKPSPEIKDSLVKVRRVINSIVI